MKHSVIDWWLLFAFIFIGSIEARRYNNNNREETVISNPFTRMEPDCPQICCSDFLQCHKPMKRPLQNEEYCTDSFKAVDFPAMIAACYNCQNLCFLPCRCYVEIIDMTSREAHVDKIRSRFVVNNGDPNQQPFLPQLPLNQQPHQQPHPPPLQHLHPPPHQHPRRKN